MLHEHYAVRFLTLHVMQHNSNQQCKGELLIVKIIQSHRLLHLNEVQRHRKGKLIQRSDGG